MAKLTFIICLTVCVSLLTAEPQCSPFHYHEQLLEKMIDVQHKMGIYSDKMEKWESDIADKLSKLEDKLEQQAELERKLTNSVNDTLADATEFKRNLRKELLDLQATARTSVVLFKARNSKHKSVSKGDTIVFQEIVQNEGNGYDNDTGIFTAPVTGTYFFTVQACLYNNRLLAVTILANGKAITIARFGDKDWNGICSSSDGQAFLHSKEEVKVLVTYASSASVIFPDSTDYWTFFSGVLLH